MVRCTCGELHRRLDMKPCGIMADESERLLLVTCPSCETTICVEVSRLTMSGRWRTEAMREV